MVLTKATAGTLDGIISSNDLVVVKFTSKTCRPCQAIAPIVDQLYERFKRNVEFAEVDIDEQNSLASRYSVSAVPTFVFLSKGQEVNRVVGANVEAIATQTQALLRSNPTPKRTLGGSDVEVDADVGKYLPTSPGLQLLNDLILASESEILNSDSSPDITKNLLSARAIPSFGVKSDADSQLLVYLPLMNRTKVHTVIIKAAISEGDDELQLPNKIKIWANTPGTISFDDATNGIKALHQSDISFDQNGYAKIELRYVLFQNVSSLLFFFDGEDEDESTIVNQILLVGNRGESKSTGPINVPEQEGEA